MNKIILFNSEYSETPIELIQDGEIIRASQKQIALIFGTTPQNVTIHFKDIFESGELDEKATCKDYLQVQIEGNRKVKRSITYYNLKGIIAVGYRVNSPKAIEFRNWAGDIISDFTTKGFVINDNLINSSPNHYENLLERVQNLRTSEKHVYEKLKECFKICSVDYDSNSQTAKDFFATIQNKFSYAITGKTAAEIILERADASKPNMGLQTWCESKIHKSDVTVAKNYLIEFELKQLQHLVLSFIEMASSFAYRRKDIKMNDWVKKLDNLINEFDYELLKDNGKVSSAKATTHAYSQYTLYKHSLNQLT